MAVWYICAFVALALVVAVGLAGYYKGMSVGFMAIIDMLPEMADELKDISQAIDELKKDDGRTYTRPYWTYSYSSSLLNKDKDQDGDHYDGRMTYYPTETTEKEDNDGDE